MLLVISAYVQAQNENSIATIKRLKITFHIGNYTLCSVLKKVADTYAIIILILLNGHLSLLCCIKQLRGLFLDSFPLNVCERK